MAARKKINNVLLISLVALCALIITLIIISLDRGINFTDEGYFLLSYKYADIYRGGIYNTHIIVTKLTNWLNPGIIEYRWMTFILTVLSSLILAVGLYKWLKKNFKADIFYKKFIIVLCFISIGNFLFYFPGFQTIHNNTLTNFFLQVATGLVLYLFSCDAARLMQSKINIAILGIIGCICGFSFFIKFSTAVLQFSTYLILFLLYFNKQSLRHILLVFFYLCIGCLTGVLVYFTFFQDFSEWAIKFKNEYLQLSDDHSPIQLISQYFDSIISPIEFSLRYFSWLIIFPFFIVINHHVTSWFKPKINHYLINGFLLFSIVLIFYEIYHFNFWRSAFIRNTEFYRINAYLYIIEITLQILLVLAILVNKKILSLSFLKTNFNRVLIVSFLLVAPFYGTIGTANPLFLNVLIHIAPWFGVILILLIYFSNHIKNPIILSLFLIVPAFVSASQVLDGTLFNAYYSLSENRSNFFKQNERIEDFPLANGVFVDKKCKTFLLEVNAILKKHNYKKGYPIFGFHIPGVVYLLEGVSPGMPYYFNLPVRDCNALERFKLNNNPPVIMVTEEYPIHAQLLNCMKDKGINFPDNYLLAGEVYFPNFDSMLKIYFPVL